MRLVRLVLALLAMAVLPLEAQSIPGGKGFSLLRRLTGPVSFAPNRASCATDGVNLGSLNYGHIGGSVCGWPAGNSATNLYLFNSGLQLAGIIGDDGGEWAADTTGAFFFDPKGTTEHGDVVDGVALSSKPADVADWPEDGRVPGGPGSLYQSSVWDSTRASDDDAWSLSWDGNPGAATDGPIRSGSRWKRACWAGTIPAPTKTFCTLPSRSITSRVRRPRTTPWSVRRCARGCSSWPSDTTIAWRRSSG